MTPTDRLVGCLIGTAVGDSLLLPAEGLSRQRIARRFPGPLRQRFLGSWGMVSDDTEHTALVAQCLCACPNDAPAFQRRLGWRLRGWIACLPAGVGFATLRAGIRLWLGWPAHRAGVVSGGNGPAMRAAVIGAWCPQDHERRRRFTEAATTLTHRHPQALAGALAMAETAAWIVRGDDLAALWPALESCGEDAEWRRMLALLRTWQAAGEEVDAFAAHLGCPQAVGGWAMRSVPLALAAWLRHRTDPAAGLGAVLACGGDTDTSGAMAGALYGTDGGEAAFDPAWVAAIRDWPLSAATLRRMGTALAAGGPPARWAWPLLPLRNLLFTLVVLAHGLRRCWP